MLLNFSLLFIFLHVTEGCSLVNSEGVQVVTAHTGESVLLPCYCTDLNSKPGKLTWNKDNRNTREPEDIVRDSVQLFNTHSPGNLSLLISHLTKEDGGAYTCDISGAHSIIRLSVKETPSTKSTTVINNTIDPSSPTASSQNASDSMHFIIPILVVLLLGLGLVFYWKFKGQKGNQMESTVQGGISTEQETQDQLLYCTVAHSNAVKKPTVIDVGDKTEYATIRLN